MELDDWKDLDSNIEVKLDRKEFKITELKLEHYWNYDIDEGMPIKTSVELTSKLNFETDKLDWKKIISHTYKDLENNDVTDTYEELVDDSIISEIEKYDLRDLNNNYYNDSTPESYTHWELTYNNYFKIVGTYDLEIEEVTRIKRLLDFKRIIEEVKDKNKLN